MTNLRNIVLDMLLETDRGSKSHIVIKNTLDQKKELDKQQRAFITRLYQGTLERRIELDYIINYFSKTPVNKMKPVIRQILRMSVYQIKYMKTVPVSAVCNEAVKLTVKRKFVNLKGFINGVLRNISREIENVEYPKDKVENISVVYSMPKWIVEIWIDEYGLEKAIEMIKWGYESSKTTVRCNTSKASVEDIIANLEYQGVTVERTPLHNEVLFLSGYDKLTNLQVFTAGFITVQNLSSVMAGMAANPQKGDYIIDVCAAPGGKSLHMAEIMKGSGTVDSRDLTEYKIGLIQENINRIGATNIVTKVMDATVSDQSSVSKADIVMADLPCSGLGVLGNKSDIKYNIAPEQIEELANLQKEILKVVSTYVKPGGKLIFSTCTVNKKENNENVKWILENLPFKLYSLEGILPKEIGGKEGYIQIFPGEYEMDGFFISAFVRE